MKKVLFVCYPKCSTCQKAKQWLESNQKPFTERDIKTNTPTTAELTEWIKKSGKPVQSFFNTSGLVYRALNLKEESAQMSDSEKINLLASNGMLIKRPLLVTENGVFVGFKPTEWEKTL